MIILSRINLIDLYIKQVFIETEALHFGEPRHLMPHLKKYFDYGKDFIVHAIAICFGRNSYRKTLRKGEFLAILYDFSIATITTSC